MRLEIKIPYNIKYSHLIDRSLKMMKNLTEHHPSRQVNSIYFDNFDYQMARDNIDGKSKRSKLRIRYYGKNDSSECFLEIKKKENKFGYKDIINLKKKINELNIENFFKLKDEKYEKLLSDAFISQYLIGDYLIPQIEVNYLRNYHLLGNIRITHDKELSFKPIGINKMCTRNKIDDFFNVLEIKFDNKDLSNAISVLDKIPLRPKRFSKYLRGLSFFNSSIYF